MNDDLIIENGISDGESENVINLVSDRKVQDTNKRKFLQKAVLDDENSLSTKKSKIDVVGSAICNSSNCTSKRKNYIKIKPPTLEEINELNETQNLYHSNLFRLQIKELLGEVRIKNKYVNHTNAWLDNFKQFLQEIPHNKDDLEWLNESVVKLPICLEDLGIENRKKIQFNFLRPTKEPYLIGAAATQTLMVHQLVADICVQMPAECFQKDNFLNLIYDQKRALYLTYIGNQMLRNKKYFKNFTIDQLKFSFYANNHLKAVLEITPNPSSKLVIRLFVDVDSNTFKLSRFVPWNNNVREKAFDHTKEDIHSSATPSYNANVLFDLTMNCNQKILRETFQKHTNFQDSLILLKIWLSQRQLDIGYNGFKPFIISMFMVYLLKSRKLNVNMSSYQIARTVWNQLAHSSWDEHEKGISLAAKKENVEKRPTLAEFHTYYDVIFIDITGFYNICANISLQSYNRLRMESKLAVNILNDSKLNSFQLLFMTKYPLYTQFDHILKINRNAFEQVLDLHVPLAKKCNYAGLKNPQVTEQVTRVLLQGLNKRVHSLYPIEQSMESWYVHSHPPQQANTLIMGIMMNSEHAYEVLDKGPESFDKDAKTFRKFWGDKAQLRRFQDGSTTESVVWASNSDSIRNKRLVVRSIIFHLLQHHFQIDSCDLEYIADQFDIVYNLSPAFSAKKLQSKLKDSQHIDAETVSLHVIRSFDDLARKLHELNELPLEIVSIAGISPVFRYCEPTPILAQARCIDGKFYARNVQYGIIQLGHSGKWPGEINALRALKISFYIQISKMLESKFKMQTRVTYDGILIIKSGYCFNIEIAHPKELLLLKRLRSENNIVQYVDCRTSVALEKRHYILPRVSSALHALHQTYPCFGSCVMIAKRWLYGQLIDDGLWPDECTELLVASLFINTVNHTQINTSPQTAFVRFLHLISNTNWLDELIFVNFNQELDENAIHSLERRFTSKRNQFPYLCIATAYDDRHMGKLWTSSTMPNNNILARVIILARDALKLFETTLYSTSVLVNPLKIFVGLEGGYDLVIQMKPDCVPSSLAYEFRSPFTSFHKPNWRLPLAGTNFMKEAVGRLREAYSDFVVFFYNPCGGKEIALMWRPDIETEREFKVSDVNGCVLNTDANRVHTLKAVIIENIKFVLKDFYLRIETVETLKKVAINSNNIIKNNRYFNRNKNI